jgi:hypothetical protein
MYTGSYTDPHNRPGIERSDRYVWFALGSEAVLNTQYGGNENAQPPRVSQMVSCATSGPPRANAEPSIPTPA